MRNNMPGYGIEGQQAAPLIAPMSLRTTPRATCTGFRHHATHNARVSNIPPCTVSQCALGAAHSAQLQARAQANHTICACADSTVNRLFLACCARSCVLCAKQAKAALHGSTKDTAARTLVLCFIWPACCRLRKQQALQPGHVTVPCGGKQRHTSHKQRADKHLPKARNGQQTPVQQHADWDRPTTASQAREKHITDRKVCWCPCRCQVRSL